MADDIKLQVSVEAQQALKSFNSLSNQIRHMVKTAQEAGGHLDNTYVRQVKRMADVANAQGRVAAQAQKVRDATEKAAKAMDSGNRSLKNHADGYNSLERQIGFTIRQMFGVYAAVMSIKKVFKEGFEFNKFVEGAEASLTVMLKSGKAARSLIDDLYQFAVKSPLRFTDTVAASKQLMAYGFQAKEVVRTMEVLGTVGKAVGVELGDMAYVYGTLRAQGRAYTRDLMQFGMRGIPIYEELAKVLGVSVKEVQRLTSEGKVGFREVEKAFENMVNTGGRFAGFFEKYMTTVEGKTQMLLDVAQKAAGALGEGLFEAWKDVIDGFIATLSDDRVINTLRSVGVQLGSMAKDVLAVAQVVLHLLPLLIRVAQILVTVKIATFLYTKALLLKNVAMKLSTLSISKMTAAITAKAVAMTALAAATKAATVSTVSFKSVVTSSTMLASIKALVLSVKSLTASLIALGKAAVLKGLAGLAGILAPIATALAGIAAVVGVVAGGAMFISGMEKKFEKQAIERSRGISETPVSDSDLAGIRKDYQKQHVREIERMEIRAARLAENKERLAGNTLQLAALEREQVEFSLGAEAKRLEVVQQIADARGLEFDDTVKILYAQKQITETQRAQLMLAKERAAVLAARRASEGDADRSERDVQQERRQQIHQAYNTAGAVVSYGGIRETERQHGGAGGGQRMAMELEKALSSSRRQIELLNLAIHGVDFSFDDSKAKVEAVNREIEIITATLQNLYGGGFYSVDNDGSIVIPFETGLSAQDMHNYKTLVEYLQRMLNERMNEVGKSAVARSKEIDNAIPNWDKWFAIDLDASVLGKQTEFWDAYVHNIEKAANAQKINTDNYAAYVAQRENLQNRIDTLGITAEEARIQSKDPTREFRDSTGLADDSPEWTAIQQRLGLLRENALSEMKGLSEELARMTPPIPVEVDLIFAQAADAGIKLETQEQYTRYIKYIKDLEAADERYTSFKASIEAEQARIISAIAEASASEQEALRNKLSEYSVEAANREVIIARDVAIAKQSIEERYVRDSIELEKERLRAIADLAKGDANKLSQRGSEMIGMGVEQGGLQGAGNIMAGAAMEGIANTGLGNLITGDLFTQLAIGLMEFMSSIENVSKVLNPIGTLFDAMLPILEQLINYTLEPVVHWIDMLGEAVARIISPFLGIAHAAMAVVYGLTTVFLPVFLAVELLGRAFTWMYEKVIMPVGNKIIDIINATIINMNKTFKTNVRLLSRMATFTDNVDNMSDIIRHKAKLVGNTLSWLSSQIQKEADKQRKSFQDLWEVGAISTSQYEQEMLKINEQMTRMDDERLAIDTRQLETLESMLDLWETFKGAEALLDAGVNVALGELTGVMTTNNGTLITVGASIDRLVSSNDQFVQYMKEWSEKKDATVATTGGSVGGSGGSNPNAGLLASLQVQGSLLKTELFKIQSDIARLTRTPTADSILQAFTLQLKTATINRQLEGIVRDIQALGGVPQFAKGTSNVPTDMLANIHKGEGIIPSSFMDSVRKGDIAISGNKGAGQSNRNTYITVNVEGNVRSDKELAKVIYDEIYVQTKRGRI